MLYSQAHNVAVYDTEEAERITTLIKDSKPLGRDKVVVPCTLFNMQVMRHLGYSAMSPMLVKYDWPGRFKPWTHQRQMASFLTLHPRCFNLSEIGTGKSMSALWAADYLMKQGAVHKALIISPLSTLRVVWENEIFNNFLSHRECVILHGSREQRLERLKQDVDFYIINHDGLGVGSDRGGLGDLAREIAGRADIDLIIVDEGSAYKDSGTTRYRVLREVTKDKPYLWWMTATPSLGSPVEAWSQVRLVNKEYRESQRSFQDRTMYRVTTFKWKAKAEAPKIVAAALQPAVRIDRSSCPELPPLTVVDREVPFTAMQTKAFKELKATARLLLREGKIDAVNEAVLRMKLIQICCGAIYDADRNVHKVDCGPRLEVTKELIEASNSKAIVFAPLTSVVNLLYFELKKKYTVELINGGVSANKRADIFRRFQQEEEPSVIVADPGTMAHGITLTAASTIIWFGPTDKPEVYTQANGRINRPGQTNKMLVARLVSSPLERGIYSERDGNEKLQNLILTLAKGDV